MIKVSHSVDGGKSRSGATGIRRTAALEESARQVPLLTAVVDRSRRSGDHAELVRALFDLGRVYAGLREMPQARSRERLGHFIANRGQLAPASRRRIADRVARLTEAEGRVADLAASGFTNREIAYALNVTPSTIEQHLTRVYRKLDVPHRLELPMALTDFRPSVPALTWLDRLWGATGTKPSRAGTGRR